MYFRWKNEFFFLHWPIARRRSPQRSEIVNHEFVVDIFHFSAIASERFIKAINLKKARSRALSGRVFRGGLCRGRSIARTLYRRQQHRRHDGIDRGARRRATSAIERLSPPVYVRNGTLRCRRCCRRIHCAPLTVGPLSTDYTQLPTGPINHRTPSNFERRHRARVLLFL